MPYLDFKIDGNKVAGHTGCNTIRGNIVITGDDITFDNMSSTKMECYDAKYEDEFKSMIFHAPTMKYKIDNGILSISKDEKAIMTLKKE